MKRKPHSRTKRTTTKPILRLLDLEHAKAAVLSSLTSLDAQRGYRYRTMFRGRALRRKVDKLGSEAFLSCNKLLSG